jgi:hypothetical protein
VKNRLSGLTLSSLFLFVLFCVSLSLAPLGLKMHFSLLSAAFLAVSASVHAHATPEMVNVITRSSDEGILKNHPWIAPKATDVRGPCPGLNTSVLFRFFYTIVLTERYITCSLANHGFLPRNGRNLTISTVLQAALGNVSVDYITFN